MAHPEIAATGGALRVFATPRRWSRYKIQVPVTVIVRRDHKTTFISGRGSDLNEGGIAVFAGTELRIGETIEISFTPPYRGLPLKARTVVRNRRGYTYGMEFLTETPEDLEQRGKISEVLAALGAPPPHRA